MRPILRCLAIALLLMSFQLQAQDDMKKDKLNPNIWEGKVLFLDHYTPADLDGQDVERGFGLGLEAGYHRHISNLLSLGIPFKVAVADMPNAGAFDDKVRIISADLVARFRGFKPENQFVPYGFVGIGGVLESINGETSENFYPQVPLGAGLHYRLGPWGYVSLQGEYRLTIDDEFERDNIQLGLGFTWQIGKPDPQEEKPPILDVIADADEDGILDKDDECPTVPGLAAFKGCPDTDGDGIADSKDKCPEDYGTAALMGCPDSDGDGITDSEDMCPDEAGTLNGCPDFDNDGIANKDDACPDVAGSLNGCPDRDADGIADKDDRCPDQAGVIENNGCPLQSDIDGDGIADKDDACPAIAGVASNRGCPAVKQEVQEVLDYAMRAVRFETGSARLKNESYAILDQIVQIMQTQSYNHLRINGHTDNTGGESSNLRLSERRAKACFDYLRSQGIGIERMSYVGYGENRPIADNGTSDGRYLNRRVEFELYIP